MSDEQLHLVDRRALTEDAERPDAVQKRHAGGGRTAREKVGDLADLIARTPADGLIAGTVRINGSPCAVLSYDYTVLAGTQGALGHRKKDRCSNSSSGWSCQRW